MPSPGSLNAAWHQTHTPAKPSDMLAGSNAGVSPAVAEFGAGYRLSADQLKDPLSAPHPGAIGAPACLPATACQLVDFSPHHAVK